MTRKLPIVVLVVLCLLVVTSCGQKPVVQEEKPKVDTLVTSDTLAAGVTASSQMVATSVIVDSTALKEEAEQGLSNIMTAIAIFSIFAAIWGFTGL